MSLLRPPFASSWKPAFLLLIVCICSNVQAQSIKPDDKDLPRFHQIDDHYFRGGQPTDEGFRKLAQMGVHLIVDLRGSDGERDEHEQKLVSSLGMHYLNLPMSTWRAPGDERVEQFIALLHENQNLPVFVHCWAGEDRTGLVTGIYRIEFYNWTGEQAYKEMRQDGFSFSLLRHGMKSYLFNYAKRKAHDYKSNTVLSSN